MIKTKLHSFNEGTKSLLEQATPKAMVSFGG
jgi:hypothetical protein